MGNKIIKTPSATLISDISYTKLEKLKKKSFEHDKFLIDNFNYKKLISNIDKKIKKYAKKGRDKTDKIFYIKKIIGNLDKKIFHIFEKTLYETLNINLKLHYHSLGYRITKIKLDYNCLSITICWNLYTKFENMYKEKDCVICFENTNNILYCGHKIHSECFLKLTKKICPICRIPYL